jgi:hypothetical protein
MKKTISQRLIDGESIYISAKKDGSAVIRVSGHLPTSANLFYGRVTKNCKDVYLIFVKSVIDVTLESGKRLASAIHLIESRDPKEKKLGEIRLNNWVVSIGDGAGKKMNYLIIDGNSEHEIKAAIKAVTKMLKTSVFKPLKHI